MIAVLDVSAAVEILLQKEKEPQISNAMPAGRVGHRARFVCLGDRQCFLEISPGWRA